MLCLLKIISLKIGEIIGFFNELKTMNVVQLAEIIWIISAIGIVVFVLLHSPKGDGIGGIGGQAQLFTSTKSAEITLNRITWTFSVLFMGLTILLSAGWLPQ